jgi:hypothetical protein
MTTPARPWTYDHSGKLEGCALFINCLPNTGGKEIYEREIDNLCQNRQLFFECYYTVFTNSAGSGATYNPVDITLKMTEVGNASNTVSAGGYGYHRVRWWYWNLEKASGPDIPGKKGCSIVGNYQ